MTERGSHNFEFDWIVYYYSSGNGLRFWDWILALGENDSYVARLIFQSCSENMNYPVSVN